MVANSFITTWPVQNNIQGWRKGPWTPEEDKLLIEYVNLHGEGRWSSVSRCAGLNRSGKSCRLRWVNYLRPGLKRGQITPQEEGIIIELHAIWGNKWSTIARYLPGRTDNEIKNYWRTHFKKKERSRKLSQRRKSQNLKPKPQMQPKEATLKIHQLDSPQVQTQEIMLESIINNRATQEKNTQVVPSLEHTNTTNKQEDLLFMYPNTIIDEQSMMIAASSLMGATCNDQDGSWWGHLWNFCDQTQQDGNSHYCGKMALSMQNQDTITTNNNNNVINTNNIINGYSWEGDLNYII